MLRVQDVGELAYGGAVTLGAYLDDKRVTKGEITSTEFWKKYSTWAYLGVGVLAMASSAMGWPRVRGIEPWMENISHGFIYGLPSFALNVFRTSGSTPRVPISGDAAARANRVLKDRAAARALGQGQGTHWIAEVPAGARSTNYRVVNDTEIMV